MSLVVRIAGAAPVLFCRRLVSDSTLGLSPAESTALRAMRLADRSIYADRLAELEVFWHRSPAAMLLFFARHGWPFSERLRETLMAKFEGRTSPEALFRAYSDAAFHYAVMLMLSMHRGQWLVPFLGDLEKRFPGWTGCRVLDYGCGASDMGAMLAMRGADVTLVDLGHRMLDFARWRYEARGLQCRAIPLADTEQAAKLESGAYDLVIATEVFEHVRDPLALLQALTAALRPGGLLFSSLGESFERDVGGDHLPEAMEVGNSAAYRAYFAQRYELAASPGGRPWLFGRKP